MSGATLFGAKLARSICLDLGMAIAPAGPIRRAFGRQLTAFDGSVFKAAVRVASLAWRPSKGNGKHQGTAVGGYRMHTHFENLRGVPEQRLRYLLRQQSILDHLLVVVPQRRK